MTTTNEPCKSNLPLEERSVIDVVVRLPKTMGPHATVADARAAFEDDHVHMILLTEQGRLLGTLVRDDLPRSRRDRARALRFAMLKGRTTSPHVPAGEARQLLVATGQRRLAVVDHSGHLLGLLCLKRRLTGFCSHADVAARAPDLHHSG